MTRQTTEPLDVLSLSTGDRQIHELARSFRESFGIEMNPPYQRGRVWTLDQRIALVRSWLTGTPTGVVILNDRSANLMAKRDDNAPIYACIDGQQRLTTAYDWFDDLFAVPASWFPAEDVTATEATDDGAYVRWSGLSLVRQRHFKNRSHLTVAVAHVATVQEEAAVYLLVNGGGTPQTDADMSNAARIADR
ncbi:DUF262 domain-containing protein [Streptomyces sp. H10-C2]|uniref:DUF262 domain-containing protein n=1 Tax=unclassified Streptomyces TaxID=2593676 RepID=UPI0024B900BB|nr:MULTISPECIES: DUF262 domain-containing protein [unclassified Streptomyces]MDJ0342231.1 DUF262 domain-containing protein [Streptomyces sp. PH10-H1]MDJ0368745.1 DUF262 domain-containing protein [Streptomyces sp. H10-C2]